MMLWLWLRHLGDTIGSFGVVCNCAAGGAGRFPFDSCLYFSLFPPDDTESYQQFRFNSKKVEEISKNLDFYALWKLEQKMSKVLDMEKVMQSVAKLGDGGNKLKYRQESNGNLPAPPAAQLQTTEKNINKTAFSSCSRTLLPLAWYIIHMKMKIFVICIYRLHTVSLYLSVAVAPLFSCV
jgi:hypothetical protein